MNEFMTPVSSTNVINGLTIWTTDAALQATDSTAAHNNALFTAGTIYTTTLYPAVAIENCKGPSAAIKRDTEGQKVTLEL